VGAAKQVKPFKPQAPGRRAAGYLASAVFFVIMFIAASSFLGDRPKVWLAILAAIPYVVVMTVVTERRYRTRRRLSGGE
jgi:hypothetical protein